MFIRSKSSEHLRSRFIQQTSSIPLLQILPSTDDAFSDQPGGNANAGALATGGRHGVWSRIIAQHVTSNRRATATIAIFRRPFPGPATRSPIALKWLLC